MNNDLCKGVASQQGHSLKSVTVGGMHFKMQPQYVTAAKVYVHVSDE